MSFVITREEVPEIRAARLAEPRGEIDAAAYFAGNGWLGRALALALMVCGAPLMLLTMLVVRATSRGPAIYRQTRVGRGGRHFVMYKFRTMRQDAEATTGAVWTKTNDARITRAGRCIRALHLDEFPQLINVLKGEMSLIGPRPERPEFTHQLAIALPRYLDRLAVLPGITGLAQINLPPDVDLDSVRRKLALDLLYVREGSRGLDFRIFVCTFARLFAIKGPRVTRLLGLWRVPEDFMAAVSGAHANPPQCGNGQQASDDEWSTVEPLTRTTFRAEPAVAALAALDDLPRNPSLPRSPR